MRISDWSSDVCSSDLRPGPRNRMYPSLFGYAIHKRSILTSRCGLWRRIVLIHNPSVLYLVDTIGQYQRIVRIEGDKYRRDSQPGLQNGQFATHSVPQLRHPPRSEERPDGTECGRTS